MAWLFQGVLNAGLQILLSIFGGWLCARLRLVDPEVMSRNVNLFAMKAAYPAFIIHLLGVKTDLRDGQAWKALGVFMLWVFIIHVGCYIFYKLRGKRSNVLQLGLNCLLLTTNNTGCIGWPVLIATVGQQSAVLSMLLGVLFFIQLLPVTICCFEYYKWQQLETKQVSTAASSTNSKGDLHTGDQLQGTDKQLALPATEFPHEFRYCYWSNELYQPSKPSPYALLPEHATDAAATAAAQQPPADLAEFQVCVESGDDTDDEAAEHHCFGGGSAPSATHSRDPSYSNGGSSASSNGGSSAAPGREWWRAGRPAKQQPGGLKRAKDSCDSLYTPFAAAAASAKQAEEQQQAQQQHRPSTMGLSSLTRRLSRGLSAAGAGVAAAAAAAVASPRALAHAASLHTAASLTKAAGPLKRAASGKPLAASLRRQPGGQDPLCQMSIPLMEEHSDEPLSCCPTHMAVLSQPTSPLADSAGVEGTATSSCEGAGTVEGPRGRDSSSSRRSSSSSIGANSSSGGASARVTLDCLPTAVPAAAAAVAAAASAASAAVSVAGKQSRLPGWGGQQPAADSAVELHFMCETMVAADCGKQHTQQQQGSVQAPAAAAAAGGAVLSGSSHWSAQLPSSSSAISLHTMGRDDSCGRFSSDTCRIGSRTNLLLPCGGINSSSSGDGGRAAAAKGASKLGRAARASNAGGPGAQAQQQQQQQQQKTNMYRRFVQQHPLLCHIVWNQMQSLHLWLNILAIALSVSGARVYLDPQSPQAIPALGFVDGVLSWFSAACIPTLLFANGVWMCGKNVWQGGLMGQLQVLCILLLKLTLLPALMVGLTLLCNIRGAYGLSLVLLASCPLAPLAFLVCQQYGFGAELSTSVTIQGVLLMLPQMMAVIKINQLGGLYDVDLVGA